LTARQGDMIR